MLMTLMTNDLNDHLGSIAIPASCHIKITCVAWKNELRGVKKDITCFQPYSLIYFALSSICCNFG